MFDFARYDAKKHQTNLEWTFIEAGKSKFKDQRTRFRQNIYTHHELKTLLRYAGFKIDTTCGLLQVGKFSLKDSWHQTIMMRK